LLTAPGAALARIDSQGGEGGGGLQDAIALVVVGVVAFRLPELVQGLLAVAGPTSGAFMRLLGLFADEAREAAWIVLPSAVLVTALAGARRDASRDLELGAACYQPFFVVRGLTRALDAVAGARLLTSRTTWIIAGLATLPVLVLAIRIARTRAPASVDGAREAAEPATSATTTTGATTTPGPLDAGARFVAAATVAIVLLGLGGSAAWSARHIDALRPIHRGQQAPEFTLPRIDATPGSYGSEALRGQVAVLDFWATWCGPCVAMIPVLDAVHTAWAPKGVAFVGINSDGGGATQENIRDFLVEHPMPYPVVVDDGHVGGLYKVEALPSLLVLGRDGRIRSSFIGYTTQATLAKALREALDAPTAP
jgi:thiol-disulfide isomerase/thioredoxin